MSEDDIRGVMSSAMGAEGRRRQVTSDAPGLGALMGLPQSPNAMAVGKSSLDMPQVGEGLAAVPGQPLRVTSYGPSSPQYADAFVGGHGYAPGDVQGAVRSLGEQVFSAQDQAAAGPGYTVISPQAARPSLWQRLAGKLRRH